MQIPVGMKGMKSSQFNGSQAQIERLLGGKYDTCIQEHRWVSVSAKVVVFQTSNAFALFSIH